MSKMSKYNPYNFDREYEYRTYKNIGKQQEIDYKAQTNIAYKIYQWIRNKRNPQEKRYMNFDNYLEWEEYVVLQERDLVDNLNFKHYLNSISRSYDWIYNVIGCVLVPVYMAIMSAAWSMFMAIFNEKVELAWMIFIGLIMGIVFGVLSSAIFSRKKHFFMRIIWKS